MTQVQETPKLQLRKAARTAPAIPPPVSGAQGLPAATPVAPSSLPNFAPPPLTTAMPVRNETHSHPVRSVITSWIVFIAVTCGLMGLQVLARTEGSAVWWYLFCTYSISLVVYSVIVIKAFFDTLGQGVLIVGIPTMIWTSFIVLAKEQSTPWLVVWGISLLAWLYIPYYVFFQMRRSPVLKGIFGALLLASFLEWPVLGERSMIGRFAGDISEVYALLKPEK